MDEWVERTAGLRQWARGGVRAPHKPLLFLYALGRFRHDADGELLYSAVEGDLRRLLAEYGPGNPTTPAYPFHHLVSDGVWEVRTDRGPGSPGTKLGQLRETRAAGRLAPDLRAALRREPSLLGRMARVLLDLNFPPSLHAELCDAVGLEPDGTEVPPAATKRRQRNRRMREAVLTAYEYRCAFCGYDGSIGLVPVGLEAAHVRWWAFDGPDVVENGLCLCSLHRKLFDKGVLGLGAAEDGAHRIIVSQSFVGHSATARDQVVALAGRPVIGPQSGARPVAPAHRSWHTGQVFRGGPRPASPSAAPAPGPATVPAPAPAPAPGAARTTTR
ncbi:phosphorothioated DNA-binding restriction endonuclease [uncultured Streptomyces sp.]|uniref:phosphorothioated DNA-binding restriction endonuclease n=1 Tax=uncultured Streptomyces sp. TaxID=174707 RepID=UPI00260B1291|nr:HNH endonuclease [uncultured Streptomyces sp.]